MTEIKQPRLKIPRFPFKHQILIIFCGILLPLAALLMELFTNICSSTFFNPIPTVWHILLIVSVPVSVIIIGWILRTNRVNYSPVIPWLNGTMVGITALYTLRFLPLTVFAFFGILFYGIGLLALAPHLALVAAIFCRIDGKRAAVKHLEPGKRRKDNVFYWSGIILAIVLLVALDLPVTFTRIGIQMTGSDLQSTRLKGIQWLRNFGNREFLLRCCYVRPGVSDLFGIFFTPASPDQARDIYYRVTGVPFNSLSRPKFLERDHGFFDDEDFDWDQGGDSVSQKVKGLSLAGSRIDGSLDPAAVLGYLEWTMVFQNDDLNFNREARAQIALPPGAVVSRVTLWVNGEEREAAFAGRATTKDAYKKVVHRVQDPVLVTTAGSDRIMIQCFPVPRNHGEMKIRLGISVPMYLNGRRNALLRLPYFVERNFGISPKIGHSVWIEAKTPLEINLKGIQPEHPAANVYTVKGLISNEQLEDKAIIRASRFGSDTLAWTEDTLDPKLPLIVQRITEQQMNPANRVILVIDGSKSLSKYKKTIVRLLPKLPHHMELKVLIASDEVLDISGSKPAKASSDYSFIEDKILAHHFEGGQDNIPALVAAMDMAGTENSVIIWIHGPQPVILSSPENLAQYWERYLNPPLLYDLQTDNGPNIIQEKLTPVGQVISVPRLYSFSQDLSLLFGQWNHKQLSIIRECSYVKERFPAIQKTSNHLGRLWAHDQVSRLLDQSAKYPMDNAKIHHQAINLAVMHQIVTPVSGAVVLENQSQYKEAGLEPVDPGTVPTIPEPGIWGLLAVVLGLMMIVFYSHRRGSCKSMVS